MKKLKDPSTFIGGLIFGTLVGLLVWYWYKSTSAEDGALDLLDRMADADSKIRELQSQLQSESVENYITLEPDGDNLPPFLAAETAIAPSEDLQRVKGIGPKFAGKLNAVGIDTLTELTAVSPQIRTELSKRGHQLHPADQPLHYGGGQVIVRDPQTGVLIGGSEPRNDGTAVGW